MFDRDGDWFIPTAATLGPWSKGVLHGGPVAGLLAHAVLAQRQDPDFALVRLTVDMPRAVPAVRLRVSTSLIRSGRRVMLVEAAVALADGRVASAIGLLLKPSSEPDELLPQDAAAISAVEDAVPIELPSEPLHHANCIELRRGERGSVWIGIDMPLIAGEPLHPAERAAVAADWANPAANFGRSGIAFINPDITLYLFREPVGRWIGIGPPSRSSAAGIAISDCPVSDVAGLAGRCATAGLAAGFEARPPGGEDGNSSG